MTCSAPKFPPPPPGYFQSFEQTPPAMSTNPKTPADVLLFAAIDCAHHIEDRQIVLKYDASKPGNALNQLTARLEAALPRAAVGIMPPVVPREPLPGRIALALARKAAKGMRDDAAHGGSMDDGGASRLESLCDAYEAGQRNAAPEFLRGFMVQAEREADPEYATYQRLHAKFGGSA